MFRIKVFFLSIGAIFFVLAEENPVRQTNSTTGQILLIHKESQWKDERYERKEGVVIDLVSKLIWKSCSEGQQWNGDSCTGSAQEFRGNQIDEQVKLVNQGGNQVENHSYNDWRIPTIQELGSLLAMDRIIPSINLTYFPRTENKNYWSSSPYGDDEKTLWVGYFTLGRIAALTTYNSGYLRLVRSD